MITQDKIINLLSKYADFSGRANRKEYWGFVLFSIILQIVVGLISPHNAILVTLLILVPTWAVLARRLHDINKSGWTQLIALIPLVGLIVLYWAVKKGDEAPNNYGPPPIGP